MLVLSRKIDESIVISQRINVFVVDIRGDKVRLGIRASKNIPVHRKEVYEDIIKEENTPNPLPLGEIPNEPGFDIFDTANGQLVLSRKRDESIYIAADVIVTIVDIRGDKVRLGIEAPAEFPVHRKEVWAAIRREIEESAKQDQEGQAKEGE